MGQSDNTIIVLMGDHGGQVSTNIIIIIIIAINKIININK
jgi:arylsulfatase A-like enzyme